MKLKLILFAMFFVSGFCGLLYQLVWTRLAMAEFGVVITVISVVISTFMAGLGLGAWWGGRMASSARARFGLSSLAWYVLCEGVIGLGGLIVPRIFLLEREALLRLPEMNSGTYLFYSALAIVGAILPWTIAMGATFPLILGFLRERFPGESRGFSYLYLANVLGAAVGTLLTAFVLVERYGFRETLLLGSKLNLFVVILSLCTLMIQRAPAAKQSAKLSVSKRKPLLTGQVALLFLFLSGFVSMGLEVIWIRAFAGRLGSSVYGLALILASYLVATALGTVLYRKQGQAKAAVAWPAALIWAGPSALLAVLLVAPSPSLVIPFLLLTVVPLAFLLGIATPAVVDDYSSGEAKLAGVAYGINILGCILGPLVASYFLLARMSEAAALLVLLLPFIFVMFWVFRRSRMIWVAAGFTGLVLAAQWLGFGQQADGPEALRLHDSTATVEASGQGMEKSLAVNHVSMTHLTTITKMMVHIPLVMRDAKPENALVICFGMGTSFRSALSWGVKTTVVELVPSVPQAFPFFFANAEESLRSPLGRIVIDDGRRFLSRTREQFDFITVDPPPPVESAASGLLFSTEFYQLAKSRLRPGGILQQWWYPNDDPWLLAAALRSIKKVFPYVTVFPSVEGWGFHFVASETALVIPSIAVALARMPEKATADLTEWTQATAAQELLAKVLPAGRKVDMQKSLGAGKEISDDLPLNEYYQLRKRFGR